MQEGAFLHHISREALFFSNLLYGLSYVFQLVSAANEDKVHVSACPKLALWFVGGEERGKLSSKVGSCCPHKALM